MYGFIVTPPTSVTYILMHTCISIYNNNVYYMSYWYLV